MANVCCTCASIISPQPALDEKTEKPLKNQRLDCCGRLVCAQCIAQNSRFATYCPFCQTPNLLEPSSQAPPAYSDSPLPCTPPTAPHPYHAAPVYPPENPPPYSDGAPGEDEKHQDVVHYLSPEDTITSLSLAYRIPAHILRQHNNLFSDHLLSARKILLIPGHLYQGPSLAPDPVEDIEEMERKAKIRRLMTRCKIHDYDVAVLYLEQSGWDFDSSLQRFEADEQWEREHPMKGKQRMAQPRSIGRRLASRS